MRFKTLLVTAVCFAMCGAVYAVEVAVEVKSVCGDSVSYPGAGFEEVVLDLEGVSANLAMAAFAQVCAHEHFSVPRARYRVSGFSDPSVESVVYLEGGGDHWLVNLSLSAKENSPILFSATDYTRTDFHLNWVPGPGDRGFFLFQVVNTREQVQVVVVGPENGEIGQVDPRRYEVVETESGPMVLAITPTSTWRQSTGCPAWLTEQMDARNEMRYSGCAWQTYAVVTIGLEGIETLSEQVVLTGSQGIYSGIVVGSHDLDFSFEQKRRQIQVSD